MRAVFGGGVSPKEIEPANSLSQFRALPGSADSRMKKHVEWLRYPIPPKRMLCTSWVSMTGPERGREPKHESHCSASSSVAADESPWRMAEFRRMRAVVK